MKKDPQAKAKQKKCPWMHVVNDWSRSELCWKVGQKNRGSPWVWRDKVALIHLSLPQLPSLPTQSKIHLPVTLDNL